MASHRKSAAGELSAGAQHILYHLSGKWSDYYQIPVANPMLWRGSHGKASIVASLRKQGLVEVKTVAKWPHRQIRLTTEGRKAKFRLDDQVRKVTAGLAPPTLATALQQVRQAGTVLNAIREAGL